MRAKQSWTGVKRQEAKMKGEVDPWASLREMWERQLAKARFSLEQEETRCSERRLRTDKILQIKSGVPEVTVDDFLELGEGGERYNGIMKHLMEI